MTTTMTIEQFKTWLATATLKTSEHIDGETDTEISTGYDEDGQPIMCDSAYASIWKTAESTLPNGTPVEITYQEMVQWQGTTSTRIDDEFETYPNDIAETWLMDGVILTDDDGEKIGRYDTNEVLSELFGSSCKIDLTNINTGSLIPAVTTLDIDTESDMEEFTVERDNEQNIRFSGEEIASVSSKQTYNDSGRWTVLKLYKTKGGKFICASIGRTNWQNETDRHSGAVCENVAEVIEFFKHGRLAKELYSEADIDDSQSVE